MTHLLASVRDIADKEFDYVIVGGGTAGCVVASRLTENPDISVAVLEAGPPHFDDPIIDSPFGWLKTFYNDVYDWQFETTPQKVTGAPFLWPRGKGIGGSSTVNWMIYNLPQRQEIDAINILGNDGWNWEKFHQYAKKSQNFKVPAHHTEGEFKNLFMPDAVGHDGPIPLTFSPYSSETEHLWQKSLQNNGIEVVNSALNGEVTGAWKSVNTIDPDTRTRVGAAKGYLLPAMKRSNLKVLSDAYVRRLHVVDGSGDAVIEYVEFQHGGKVYTVKGKEVILSAGVPKSPQVLELSGIGDPEILRRYGVPVKVNLPAVGTNLQEHIVVGLSRWQMKADKGIITSGMLDNAEFAARAREKYGDKIPFDLTINCLAMIPLQKCTPRAAEIIQQAKEKYAHRAHSLAPGLKEQYDLQFQLLEDPEVPDFEILYLPFMFPAPFPEPDKPHIAVLPILSRPFSRGTIHIASSDPKVAPEIDPNYVQEAIDFDIIREGFKFIRKVTQTSPWADHVEKEESPGNEVQTDEHIDDYISKSLFSSFHGCGGCPMLPRDKGGVVNPKLKVYGTENLRVVDLSMMPVHVSGHPQGTAYAIGEFAADIIKSER